MPDTELSVSNPAEPPPGSEMKYGRASHYAETCSSHLVIDGLGGGLCPHPPLGNCLLLWGLGIFEAMLENKKEMFPFHSALPISLCTTVRIYIHKYLRLHTGSSHPPSPQQKKKEKKKATRFQSNTSKLIPITGVQL